MLLAGEGRGGGTCLQQFMFYVTTSCRRIFNFETLPEYAPGWNSGFPPLKENRIEVQERSDLVLHCKENPIYVFLSWELRGLSPNFHINVIVSDLHIPRISPHISLLQRGRPILEIYKSLKDIYECRNWETEYYNSILEEAVSFLGINKWEPAIYIGFSPVLHLQCII